MGSISNPNIENLDGVAFLAGYPIAHSLSPVLHHVTYTKLGRKWEQLLYETKDLDAFMRYIRSEPKLFGSGITMPYKVAVIPYLDGLTDEGKAIGAINTIFFDPVALKNGEKKFIGTNTDCIGVSRSLSEGVKDPVKAFQGKPGLIIGGGGTCRAAIYALRKLLGCSTIYIINREKSEVDMVLNELVGQEFGTEVYHIETLDQAKGLETPGAIVNAVPDFAPVTEKEKVVRAILEQFLDRPQKGAMLEMCYHPHPHTGVFKLGESKGWSMVQGTEAMIWQGVEQARLWTGLPLNDLPVHEAREAVRSALAARIAGKH